MWLANAGGSRSVDRAAVAVRLDVVSRTIQLEPLLDHNVLVLACGRVVGAGLDVLATGSSDRDKIDVATRSRGSR